MTATPTPTNPLNRPPRSGDVYRLTEQASPQFKARPIWARLIRIQDWYSVADGWIWIEVFELNPNDLLEAIERRPLFVRLEGLELREL